MLIAPDIDSEKKRISVSVRELAEDRRFYPIGSDRGGGWASLADGADLHRRILAARQTSQANYRAEVHLQGQVAVDDWTAVITGRLDGCHDQDDGGVLVEEFKSAFLGSGGFKPASATHDRYLAQLKIYCHLLALSGNRNVAGSLVYVDVSTGREMAFPYAYDEGACREFIEDRLRSLISEWLAGEDSRRAKAALAPNLPFPHAAPRPGQRALINSISECIHGHGHLLAEAPTGSGKTAASIYPALQAALSSGRQLVFLTAKNLQQIMAVNALKRMNPEGVFRTAQIRSKERMCANGQVLCHEDFCPYAKRYPEKMESSGLLDRLLGTMSHFDPDAVFAEAKSEEVCPFEVQLELAERSDAIVADYNYVFEPAAVLRHLALEGLDRALLVIDEAHNLPDRARNIFSPALLESELKAVYQHCFSQTEPVFERLAISVEAWLAVVCRLGGSLGADDEAIREITPPITDLQALFEDWLDPFLSYLGWKRERKLFFPDDTIVMLHFALQRFAAVLKLFGPGFTCTIARRDGALKLSFLCLDPARAIAGIFQRVPVSVLLSATLSPADIFIKSLGLEPDRVHTLSLPPPFPKENRRIMILPQVRTSYQARERSYAKIGELISAMSESHPANYLILFPSYAFLRGVAGEIHPGSAKVVTQRANLTAQEREQILKELTTRPPGGILLLAVLGGMYAEGVDYPGDLLSGVFVVSPALPQVSFERELLRRYYNEAGEPGFDYAYLQPGMTRVIQAAGRLIRSETDRGVIVLLCARFLENPYRSWLPKDWYEESPIELVSHEPGLVIREFFESSPGAPSAPANETPLG